MSASILPACGAGATPDAGPRCQGGQYRNCTLPKDHSGPHARRIGTCNRPAGHEGDHMVLSETAERLARWPRLHGDRA